MPFAAFYIIKSEKKRIAENRRHDYAWTHNFEHLAIWIYFYCVNYEILNITLIWHSLAFTFLTTITTILITLVSVNLYIYFTWRNKLPDWVDKKLLPKLEQKIKSNLFSFKIYNYLNKPFNHRLSNDIMTWGKIERLIKETNIDSDFDIVIGIGSGGAFIAKYIANKLGIDEVSYFWCKYWSLNSLSSTLAKTVDAVKNNESFLLDKCEATFDSDSLVGKRVLLVDDSVSSGTTMRECTKTLYTMGARDVRTFSMFCYPNHLTNYYSIIGTVPIIWPWGAEVD